MTTFMKIAIMIHDQFKSDFKDLKNKHSSDSYIKQIYTISVHTYVCSSTDVFVVIC